MSTIDSSSEPSNSSDADFDPKVEDESELDSLSSDNLASDDDRDDECVVSMPRKRPDSSKPKPRRPYKRRRVALAKTEQYFTCDICGKALKSKQTVKLHKQIIHEGNRPFPCHLCSSRFTQKAHLRQHIATIHQDLQPHKCDKCGRTFTKQDFEEHSCLGSRERKGPRPYPCDKCDRMFSRPFSLRMHHEAVHEGILTFSCNICQTRFQNSAELRTHRSVDHAGEIIFTCNICSMTFKQPIELRDHRLVKHPSNRENQLPFKCDDCDKSFGQSAKLIKHRSAVHEVPIKCDDCEKSFSHLSKLIRHRSTVHEGRRPYVCDVCNARFSQNVHLKQHRTIVHEGKRPFHCEHCDRTFTQGCHLRVHKCVVDRGHNTFACTLCDKAFAQAFLLQKHIEINHKDRTFSCHKCNFTCNREALLRTHCVNALETPVKCLHCEHTCCLVGDLLSHINTEHAAARQDGYRCGLCGNRFSALLDWRSHIKSCADGGDFKCEHCDKAFRWKLHLRHHRKSVHGKHEKYNCKKCDRTYISLSTFKHHLCDKLVTASKMSSSSEVDQQPEFSECDLFRSVSTPSPNPSPIQSNCRIGNQPVAIKLEDVGHETVSINKSPDPPIQSTSDGRRRKSNSTQSRIPRCGGGDNITSNIESSVEIASTATDDKNFTNESRYLPTSLNLPIPPFINTSSPFIMSTMGQHDSSQDHLLQSLPSSSFPSANPLHPPLQSSSSSSTNASNHYFRQGRFVAIRPRILPKSNVIPCNGNVTLAGPQFSVGIASTDKQSVNEVGYSLPFSGSPMPQSNTTNRLILSGHNQQFGIGLNTIGNSGPSFSSLNSPIISQSNLTNFNQQSNIGIPSIAANKEETCMNNSGLSSSSLNFTHITMPQSYLTNPLILSNNHQESSVGISTADNKENSTNISALPSGSVNLPFLPQSNPTNPLILANYLNRLSSTVDQANNLCPMSRLFASNYPTNTQDGQASSCVHQPIQLPPSMLQLEAIGSPTLDMLNQLNLAASGLVNIDQNVPSAAATL